MMRGRSLATVVLLAIALSAGILVGVLVPPLRSAWAETLQLAPPPAPTASVVVPSFADLAEKAIPAVVFIRNARKAEATNEQLPEIFRYFERDPNQEPNSPEQDLNPFRRRPPNPPQVSSGTGFFFTTDGYVMTNRHVVEGAENLMILTSENEEHTAKLIGVDPHLDLAVLKVDLKTPVAALPLGESESLRVGEWVIAVGYPLGFSNSVTVGVVSGKERNLGAGSLNDIGDYIQTDAAINFGNSGGPLLNARGEVVGINTAIIRGNGASLFGSNDGAVEGIGFALPITQAKSVLQQLVATGTVKRGYMGVSVEPVTQLHAESYSYPHKNGALVSYVNPDSPAQKAGVKQGDIIMSVDGRQIRSSNDLVNVVSSHAPGEKVRLALWRDGNETSATVTLTNRGGDESLRVERNRDRSEPESNEARAEAFGITVGALPPRFREQLVDAGQSGGVLIIDVADDSEAARRGISSGTAILSVNGKQTTTVTEFVNATKSIDVGSVVRLQLASPSGDTALRFFRRDR
jgi:serine protease Do